jgi:single-stranded-DNA-specific exonuclease
MSTPAPFPSVKWQAAPAPEAAAIDAVLAHKNLHPAVARIIARRVPAGASMKAWLDPLRAELCNPYQIHDMAPAIARLRVAAEKQQYVIVFGDYDTDGITATALMTQALHQCGVKVTAFTPDRETEGYGLTPAAMERCLREKGKPDLLVTVDCGISSVAEVEELNRRGVEVIITDHHVPPEVLPPALALVNPRLGAPEGAGDMCGCATAHTLIRALFEFFPGCDHRLYLDLVSVATVADVMALTGENRSLVAKGLYILGKSQNGNPGLHALAEAQHLAFSTLTAEQLAFKIIPCINAASRIGQCSCATNLINLSAPVRWLAQSDEVKCACRKAAEALKAANQTRREVETRLRDVIQAQHIQPMGNLILAAGTREEGFHSGVLGIVAARLAEQFNLPAAVCCIAPDGSGSGSVRSRGAWHAVKALDTVSDLLAHYGGHAAASGFALNPGAFEAFRERFPKAFAEVTTEEECIIYDEALTCEVDEDLLASLEVMEPFGTGNPKPVFAKTFILNAFRPIGSDKSHLSLTLRDPARTTANFTRAVWFGAAHRATSWVPGLELRLLFTVGRDAFDPKQVNLQIIDAITV